MYMKDKKKSLKSIIIEKFHVFILPFPTYLESYVWLQLMEKVENNIYSKNVKTTSNSKWIFIGKVC